MIRYRLTALAGLFLAVAMSGCSENKNSANASANTAPSDEVSAVRAKLSPEDRALVEAQEWCVISTDERLGGMGAPIKIEIQGKPVFLCCKGCKKKAEANPEKTLAKLEELKAKAKKKD